MRNTILTAIVILALAIPGLSQAPASATVSLKYVAAADALAADNFANAKAALASLANESQGDLKLKAQAAADAANIAAMRKAFKPLSEAIVKMNLPAGYSVAFCPMYEKGSSWVQKDNGKIANPYYGKTMLTCGEFRK